MKRRSVIILLLFISLVGCQSVGPVRPQPQTPPWTLCFSPRGGCTQLIVDTLSSAQSTVLVQAYSFTSEPIAQALVEVHTRGVDVEVILDKSQRTEDNTRAKLLMDAGIPVRIDAAHAIAHNKVMIIDQDTVITGSFNFTKGAEERNAENLLVIHDKTLAAKYDANWHLHEAHSQPYVQ